MDLNPTPFPVKSKYMKPKPTRKIPQASKINKVEPLVQSEKRVFGTARNPNIPQKTAPTRGKPATHLQKKTCRKSAEICSKCRFDRLETSPYWLSQIRLAETVGKHSVSAVFFRLAFDCHAEPFRNIRLELKKYMARHKHLNGEVKWKKLLVSYGLVKEESSTGGQEVKAGLEEKNEQVIMEMMK
ncbi:Unknown protein [Striga hermonthica]|uniref:Uncharacterized protein n=1 Tax=Striga hermonthica TaxID=68872 RepID=A0A9N7NGU2_STRHE|nr:Unknown protein [Striga hermonthica]